MDYQGVETMMLNRLKSELPEHLSYHSVAHVKDVLQAAIYLAEKEGVTGSNLILIKTAAIFHDSGFLYGAKDHEEKSCTIAAEELPKYGFSAVDIATIQGMIMATKIPQSPQNHLEEILADADLDYLGRADFFTIGNYLYEELAMFGMLQSERDWNLLQERFLEGHRYFTATAINERKSEKEAHLALIKQKLAQI